MEGVISFAESVREVVTGLREYLPGHAQVNRASARIDYLGRQLHGIGIPRDREIARCFAAALLELDASHSHPDEARARAVDRAASHLEHAITVITEAIRPRTT